MAVLNDFIIEDLDSADCQTKPARGVPILQCRESIWLWKVFNELLRSSFPWNRTGVYSGKVRLDDAGTRRWKRGVPSFVICFRPDTAVSPAKNVSFLRNEMCKKRMAARPFVLRCLVAMLIKLLGIEALSRININ